MDRRSSYTNSLCFTQYLSRVIGDLGQIDVIYFANAFDSVDDEVLLSKLFVLSDPLIDLFAW